MKQENNELDYFLQEKVDEAQFEFKDSYWAKMENMLNDEEKPSKKRFAFWRGLSIAIGLVLVGALAYIGVAIQNKSERNDEIKLNSKNSLVQLSQTQSVKNDTLLNEERQISSASTPTIANMTNAEEDSNRIKRKNLIKEDSRNNKKVDSKRYKKKVAKVESLNDTTVLEKVDLKKVVKAKIAKRKHYHISQSHNTLNANSASKSNQNTNAKIAKSENEKENSSSTTSNVHLLGNSMKAVDTTIYTGISIEEQMKLNPRYREDLKSYVPERLEKITIITYESNGAKTATNKDLQKELQVEGTKDTISNINNLKPISLFCLLGANLNKGFKSNLPNSMPWGFAPFATLGMEKQISKKISIAAQVGFTYFNALNIEQRVQQYKYSFGVDSSEFFKIDYKKLWQLYLPLSVQYHLNSKHNLFASAGLSYSFEVNSLITDSRNSTLYPANGYRNGFNPWDVLMQIGYSYNLTNKLSALLMWQQGIMDMTKNNYFDKTQKHTQAKISIGIKYNFKRNGK